MPLWKYSQTAASNGVADPSSPFPEGQAPSSVNDSVRGMMAALAMYRDDIAGAIVTAGTNLAYTVATFSGFDTLAHLDKQMVAFTPHTTNGAGPLFLNVDSTGSKPLRPSPGVEFPAGVLILGTPYVAVYNNTDGAWYVQGGFGNPYNVPIGCGLDFWGTIAPNAAFTFPVGQAISRTAYPVAFNLFGTSYGAGDGSTTFNLPDKRGRVSVGYDNGNITGRQNGAYSGGVNAGILGASGGEQGHLLTAVEAPAISSAGTASVTFGGKSVPLMTFPTATTISPTGGAASIYDQAGAGGISFASSAAGSASVVSNNTGGAVHNNAQPSIVCNYIMRII